MSHDAKSNGARPGKVAPMTKLKPKPELVSCAKCGRRNFTPAGLTRHVCRPVCGLCTRPIRAAEASISGEYFCADCKARIVEVQGGEVHSLRRLLFDPHYCFDQPLPPAA